MKASRTLVLVAASILTACVHAQGGPKAAACFWSVDFELGMPLNWDIGPMVERQTSFGDSLDEFVPAWTIGTAAEANANGSFPVRDQPAGNRFLMANDDALPCNCTMADAAVTTGPIDLTGRTGTGLSFRYFHEMTLGSGPARVEFSTNGSDWELLAELPAQQGEWQDFFADLGIYDGEPAFQLRFRWSDGGGWASGFALDDLCFRELVQNDLAITRTFTHDATISPFLTGDQSLRYRMLPLEQAGPFTVAAEVVNLGRSTQQNVVLEGAIALNGVVQGAWISEMLAELQPGQRAILTVPTGWTPGAVGEVVVTTTVNGGVGDDDPADNMATAAMRITGAGWDAGYGTMAVDEGLAETEMTGTGFWIAANRMEVRNPGSLARGISVVVSSSSAVGGRVRAVLLDEDLTVVDTAMRHTLTQADLDLGWAEGPLYMAFDTPVELEPGDYFVGIQQLDEDSPMVIRTAGTSPIGAAVRMDGLTFDVSYVDATPMVRLHLSDYNVGIAEGPAPGRTVGIHPVPMADNGWITFELTGTDRTHLRLLDAAGRTVHERDLGLLPAGPNRVPVDVAGLAEGVLLVELRSSHTVQYERFVVRH
jgi:hypothetical protein